MRRARKAPTQRSSAIVWLVLALVVMAGLGAGLDAAAPHSGAGFDRVGVASGIGIVAAVGAALVAHLLRFVLGRRTAEEARDAVDRA